MTGAGFRDDPNRQMLSVIAEALGDLCDELVLVGGCATGLLLTAPRATAIRQTLDVDVVAPVLTTADYHAMERALERRGFKHDISPEAPICRWILGGVILDLMPSRAGILGFHNCWYPLAVETATRFSLSDSLSVRLITAPVFVASKLEAFHGRGNRDYLASHDLEDLVTVIDGRPELIDEVRATDPELGDYLVKEMHALLSEPDFQMALPGHLPGDAASQARLPELIHRLRRLAQIVD